jgi:hypothetical protein
VIDNWYILKLEFLQSVIPNIRQNGAAIQWSADATKRPHITEIKNPSDSGNNQHYESQICRYLDQAEKCQNFNLATAVHDASVDFWSANGSNFTELVKNPEPLENETYHQVDTMHALLLAITPTK